MADVNINQGMDRLLAENMLLEHNFHGDLPPDAFQVIHRPPQDVIARCEDLRAILELHRLDNPLAEYRTDVPSRTPGNQRFVRELRRFVLIRRRRLTITPRRIPMFIHVLGFILQSFQLGQLMSIRLMYYTSARVFDNNYDDCRDCILDLCVLLDCDRESLGIIPGLTGLAIGDLQFQYGPRLVDCMQNMDGESIPQLLSTIDVTTIHSDARFILIVESHATFTNLKESGYHVTRNCILITPRGCAGATDLEFIHMLWLQLPVVLCLDGDPHGFRQWYNYVYGSPAWSFNGRNLVTPMRFIGVWTSDIVSYGIHQGINLTDHDRLTLEGLIEDALVRRISDDEHMYDDEELHFDDEQLQYIFDEMTYMRNVGQKISLGSFCMNGLNYLAEVIDLKLSNILPLYPVPNAEYDVL